MPASLGERGPLRVRGSHHTLRATTNHASSVENPRDSHEMSTAEEAVLSVAAPPQIPQEPATEPAVVLGPAFSGTEETRSVDDLFLATAHDPVASLPSVNTVSFTPRSQVSRHTTHFCQTYRHQPQLEWFDAREPLVRFPLLSTLAFLS